MSAPRHGRGRLPDVRPLEGLESALRDMERGGEVMKILMERSK